MCCSGLMLGRQRDLGLHTGSTATLCLRTEGVYVSALQHSTKREALTLQQGTCGPGAGGDSGRQSQQRGQLQSLPSLRGGKRHFQVAPASISREKKWSQPGLCLAKYQQQLRGA